MYVCTHMIHVYRARAASWLHRSRDGAGPESSPAEPLVPGAYVYIYIYIYMYMYMYIYIYIYTYTHTISLTYTYLHANNLHVTINILTNR